MALGNRYNRPLVNSVGGISQWDDTPDPNAAHSQQANRNAQGGWGDNETGEWVPRPVSATAPPTPATASTPTGGSQQEGQAQWSNFTLPGVAGDQERTETGPYEPPPQQRTGGYAPNAWYWWRNFRAGAGADPRVPDWWKQYATTQGMEPSSSWLPSSDAWVGDRRDSSRLGIEQPWIQKVRKGWHEGWLTNPDPYDAGLTYHRQHPDFDAAQGPYDWTGTQWRTGVPEYYHLDPTGSNIPGFQKWASTAGEGGGPLKVPWDGSNADAYASWYNDPDFREQWAQKTWADFSGPDAGDGTYGSMPTNYDEKNERWNPWLRTDGGRDHTQTNIMGVLQSIFPGQFNKAGLAAALPTLQWLFGKQLKIVGSDGDKIDFGGSLGVVDLVRDAKGEQGGTAWIWLPDKDNPNLHGGGGQSDGGTWMDNRYSWFNPAETPQVNVPTPGPGSRYTPSAAPTDGLPTYGGFTYGNERLPSYEQFQYNPNIAYRPPVLDQFQQPNQSNLNQLQQTTVQQMLENPTLSDQVLSQMREQHKDTVLSLGEQLGQLAAQRAAAQGTFGGGTYGSSLGDIQRSMAGDITKGYRDLNVQAADINRQARERALTASENILGGQMDRGIAGYQAGLGGRLAQESLMQQGVQSLREAELLRAQEHQRWFANELGNRAWLREGQQLQAGEDQFAFGTQQAAAANQYERYLRQEELRQASAQQELERYQAWANQQAAQQQLAINMFLGRGDLYNRERLTNLAGQQEMNDWDQWLIEMASKGLG